MTIIYELLLVAVLAGGLTWLFAYAIPWWVWRAGYIRALVEMGRDRAGAAVLVRRWRRRWRRYSAARAAREDFNDD